MNKKIRRMNQLVNILKESRQYTVKELASRLDISEMTVRRDLAELREAGLMDQLIVQGQEAGGGGETRELPDDAEREYDLGDAQILQNAEKDRIGAFAAGLIEPGDIIIIDTGSTTDKLVRYVPGQQNITVLCYNFNVLSQLQKKSGVNLIFAGGYFHPKDQMFESDEGLALIRNIRAHKLFISASGVHEKLGMTCGHDYEVRTKRAVLQSALTKILLADSTKFGKVRSAYFAQLSEIDVIVTDQGLSPEWRGLIDQMGIKLHLV